MGNNRRKLKLLLWKNFTLQIRRPIGTLVELLLPIAFMALLLIARDQFEKREVCSKAYEKVRIDDRGYGRLAYFPITQNTTYLLESAIKRSTFTLVSASVLNKPFTTLDDIISDISNYSDLYVGVITFGNMKSEKLQYSIRLRDYDSREYLYNGFVLLQYYIDSAIIQWRTGNMSLTAPRYIQKFPFSEYTDDTLFVASLKGFGPLLFVLAFFYSATEIVKELVAEKQLRLKESMKMMGLPNWIHWLAWFLKSLIFFTVIIVLQTLLLRLGSCLVYTHVIVMFLTLLFYVLASICSLFLISVLFSNGTRAILFTTILWFASYGPFMSFDPKNPDGYATLPTGQKFALCLLPNTCLGVMMNIITSYEQAQAPLGLSQINTPVNEQQDFLLNDAYLMLAVDCFVFLLLTWYIENVFPGEFGIPQPFYFPFKKSYWCGEEIEINSATTEGNLENFEEEPVDLEVGVSINNLRKVFDSATGKKTAVDGVNLNIYKGQITALIGHNGAGKTTSLSILTGLFPPTSGTATINGKSILTDMESVRDSLGVCPQHNVLFDRLTVKEHLEFFSALKGVSKSDGEDEIMKLITDMQLLDKINARVASLSGGMKRKLCCAIALVGGSETVFLDEPTSGMDPYARRATWDVLQQYREQKTIILTTHFMDEADYLGDRIAIMVDGQIHCCGSSLYLKKRYGVGYHLVLVKDSSYKERETHSLIRQHIPDAKMVGHVAAEVSYVLSEDSTNQFKALFEKFEDEKDVYGITNFGISVTTMEEVFLKVGEEAKTQANASEENVLGNECANVVGEQQGFRRMHSMSTADNYVLVEGLSLKVSQLKAMFRKRFLNSKRKKTAIITQLLLPLVLLLLGFLLVYNIQHNYIKYKPPPARQLTLSMLKTKGSKIVSYFSDNSASSESEKLALSRAANSYYESVDVQPKNVRSQIHDIINGNRGDNVSVLYSNLPPYQGNLKSGLSPCCHYQYLVLNEKCNKYLSPLKDFCSSSKSCFAGSVDGLQIKGSLHSRSIQEYFLETAPGYTQYYDRDVAGFTVDDNGLFTVLYTTQAYDTLPSAYSAVSNIILKTASKNKYGIVTYNHPLPNANRKEEEMKSIRFLGIIVVVFATMSSCSLAASFIPFLVTEKVTKAKHVQFVSGVNSICYWGGTLCWDFINFMVPGIGFLILFAIFDLDGYTGALGAIFFLIVLFALSVLPFVYILSYLFTGPTAAYEFISSLVMILSMACYLAVKFVTKSEANIMHHVFLIFPTYAFPKALDDLWINVLNRKQCAASPTPIECKKLLPDTFAFESPGIGTHCLYMCIVSLLYFLIVILLEENLLGRFLPSTKHTTAAIVENEDVDVQNERRKVKEMLKGDVTGTALLLEDLTKVYRTNGMMAVDHVTAQIAKGECFGLLGINGAGKTTTFGMLTGELSMTEGSAYLHGMDITTRLKEVQQLIGYCPQFDALIDTLTGREMLEMYARLRGVPDEMVKDVVNSIINNLQLEQWASKMCGTYSGGNKRKLSTALALVGDPSVIFLDEPTSGMDPGARRHLWNTLSDVLKTGRSIVLTSHSMEECEALCTRLVIMVNGKFKCIGSLQHLKSRFGQGYVVMLKVDRITHGGLGAMQKLKDFMNHNFPGAIILEEHHAFIQFHVESHATRLSHMFGIFEENAESLNIIDYSVSQTTLDEIFINFAKEQHSEERVKKKTCCSCTFFLKCNVAPLTSNTNM